MGRKPTAAGQFESPTPPKNDAFGPEQVIYTIASAPRGELSPKFQTLDRIYIFAYVGTISHASWPAAFTNLIR